KQKKLLEEALNNAKLSYVAKNTFLSNMSHDMRTPLNAIFGYTALAKKNVKDSELTKSYLDKIETAGRSILNLVNRVLELSYMESQEFRIDEAQCNLHDVIQQVYRTALDEASAKDITISLHSSSLKHGDVYADKDKLKQILDRIVGNAVKYTRNGGHVDIDVTEESSASDDFSTFRFSVKDNGVGISEQFIKRIFEPFERENNTTLSGVYGSGLGLTIAKHLVDMMGGSIETNSVSADTKKMLAYLKGKKILLVEDNEINIEIETEMLQDLGIKIVPAENGQIAVDKMSKAKPDEYVCVLMDIQMPVMDGRQAAAHIRKLPSAAANTPIIALSANAFENDKKLSLEAGMNDHITKPLEIAAFLKSLAKY
ncbi:MAG: ATP-binding protein, partial [Clostridia bacterium]|nr:ATP-binding protein [Clostridia bacterium]